MQASGKPGRVAIGHFAVSVAIWVVFILAVHALIHRFLPVTGPVPGTGLATLGLQMLLVTGAAHLLLMVRHPSHLITVRAFLATVIWVGLILFGHYLMHLDAEGIQQTLTALHDAMGISALMASAFLLVVLLGLPFVPSVEMGLMMMAVFGREGAVAAWLATIAGLSLAHAAGRYMPADRVRRWLERHGLLPANPDSDEPMISQLSERLHLSNRMGPRMGAFLLRHRYLLFAALLNSPGNSLLGGGGGIALVCGFARLYRWPLFLLTVALATLPIPLLVFLGLIRVDDWLAALGGR